jgi:glycosyltransferase involved in cell wall biosynthesis
MGAADTLIGYTMAHRNPLVVFDFSGLDRLNIGNGQFRYCVDLITGLAGTRSEFRFVVAGSGDEPPAEIRDVFRDPSWRYAQFLAARVTGGLYLDHVRFALWLRRQGAALLHAPHTFVPLVSRVPVVVTIYDLMSEIFPEYRARVVSRPYRLFKLGVRKKHPVAIAISQTTAADLARFWHVDRSRIHVVPLGIDAAHPREVCDARVVEAARGTFILSPYNLEPRKNLQALLAAMSAVRRIHPDVRVVLYGRAAVTPERESQFRQEVQALGLGGAIAETGFVQPHELAFLLGRCALFVFPSLYEGFGLPVLEAMHAGCCVVARNESAMAEVLGDAGVQLDTRDVELVARTICTLLDDRQRREAYGSVARTRARQFSRGAMVQGTLTAYRSALERN